jgi:hypothetical protein
MAEMWIVSLYGPGNPEPHVVRVYSNSPDDLFDNREFRLPVLQRLMTKGLLEKIEIDFRWSEQLDGWANHLTPENMVMP